MVSRASIGNTTVVLICLRLAMSFLDPHLPDGPHDWRDGRRVFKKGDKLVIDGTDTLAGR